MDSETFTLALVLTTSGAALGGGLVAAIVQLVKKALPENWQTGRAVLVLVYVLSVLLVIGALIDVKAGLNPASIFAGVLAWQAIAAIAVGSYEVTAKVARVATGTTNPVGADN